MHRMQQIQNLQNKRLQQSLSSVAELSVQIVELKKRLEDVDAKNREISANIRHMSGGEATKNDNGVSNATIETENIEESNLLLDPNTSSSAVNFSENSNKRRIDTEDNVLAGAMNSIQNVEDSCDLRVKKPKL